MSKREYGTGSIYPIERNGKQRWAGQCRIGYDANGNPKKKTVYGKTKKEVKEKLAKIQAEVLTGIYIEPSKLTITQIATSINDNKKALNTITEVTYHRNKETIKIIQRSNLDVLPVQKVTEPILTAFFTSITDYSSSVIKKVYTTLNTAFNKAIAMDIIHKNPMADINRPQSNKKTRKVNALTVEQQKALIAALNADNKEPYRTMLLIELFAGARMGEITAIARESYNSKLGTIDIKRTMTKDSKDRPVIGDTTKTFAGLRRLKLSPALNKVLKDYCKTYYKENEYGLLFIDKNNRLITTNQANSYYCRLIERYNIAPVKECNQHQLRHTYATRCIESGMPPKVLQYLLGHTDISTTLNIYTDVTDVYSDKYASQAQAYLEHNKIAI